MGTVNLTIDGQPIAPGTGDTEAAAATLAPLDEPADLRGLADFLNQEGIVVAEVTFNDVVMSGFRLEFHHFDQCFFFKIIRIIRQYQGDKSTDQRYNSPSQKRQLR